jgi:hypothetical protein
LKDEHHVTLDYRTVLKGKQKASTYLYGSWEENCNNPNFWEIEINGIYQNTKFWSQQKLLF